MFDHKHKVCDGDVLDLTSFNVSIPKPEAEVDIELALREYNRDRANIDFLYMNNVELSVETNWLVLHNYRDWARFWSERHPNVAERARMARELCLTERSIQRVAAKARAALERRLRP
jgi:hypothetical protein